MIRIEEFLPRGKENAISTENLCKVTGITDKRALQQEIARERAEGVLILSHYSGGYYLPLNRSEVVEFARTLENRAKNTFVALRGARRYLKQTEGQIHIEFKTKKQEKEQKSFDTNHVAMR